MKELDIEKPLKLILLISSGKWKKKGSSKNKSIVEFGPTNIGGGMYFLD